MPPQIQPTNTAQYFAELRTFSKQPNSFCSGSGGDPSGCLNALTQLRRCFVNDPPSPKCIEEWVESLVGNPQCDQSVTCQQMRASGTNWLFSQMTPEKFHLMQLKLALMQTNCATPLCAEISKALKVWFRTMMPDAQRAATLQPVFAQYQGRGGNDPGANALLSAMAGYLDVMRARTPAPAPNTGTTHAEEGSGWAWPAGILALTMLGLGYVVWRSS